MNLLKNTKWYYAGAAVAAASNTNDDSAAVDMQGFDGVVFVASITDSVSGGVATVTAKQCDTSGGTYAALSGAVATATSASNDDLNSHLLIVDVYRPQERYLKLNRVSATQNIAFGDVVAILYKGSKAPVTQLAAEVSASTTVVSPAES